jgi:hypothetical protein
MRSLIATAQIIKAGQLVTNSLTPIMIFNNNLKISTLPDKSTMAII